jgi:hypothetical protein
MKPQIKVLKLLHKSEFLIKDNKFVIKMQRIVDNIDTEEGQGLPTTPHGPLLSR